MKRTRPIALVFAWFAALLTSSPAGAADIRPAVSAAAQAGTLTRVLVILKAQADLSGARGIQNRKGKGADVFAKLREAAAQTQGPVVARVMGMGLAAKPFFIMNAIYVEARPGRRITPQQLEALGAEPGVAKIRSAEVQADLPVEKKNLTAQITANYSGPLPNIVQIGAPTVWAKGYSGKGVVIGFIDTGEDATFPDIATKYRGYVGAGQPTSDNYNFFDPSPVPCPNPLTGNPMPCDTDGHGTHVTGTAVGSNPVFQIGVAPDAQWIGCRAITAGATVGDVLTCLQWMLAPTDVLGNNPDPTKAPDIVNNSYFCQGCDIDYAFTSLRSAGIVPVAAVGNFGPYCLSAVEPGGYPDVVGVGAVLSNGTITAFSSRGPYIDYNDNLWAKPDVSAPGAAIVSALANTTGYTEMSGTSMASPHVAGEIALLLSANPSLDFLSVSGTTPQPADVLPLLGGVTGGSNATLNSTCDLYGPTGQVYGAGTINVPNALQILVGAHPLLIGSTDTELPANASLSIPVGATGGAPAYRWTLTDPGNLPAGLAFNAGVGVLSGTPSLGGLSYLQFQVTDSAQGSGTAFINLSVLGFATTALPAGTVGIAYFATPGAAGGSGSYGFQFSCLPPGLSDDGIGDITGIPTQAGGFSVCATVNDNTTSATQNLSLTIVRVEAPPSIATSFAAGTIGLNAAANLTFTVTNPTGNQASLNGVAFTDTLPAGLTVTSAASAACGGALTVTAPVTIALSGATVATGAPCQFNISVTGAAPGAYTNVTGNVTSANSGMGNTATAKLTVASPPSISKGFSPASIAAGGTSALTLTITNPNAGFTLTGVAFNDSFPSGMVVASSPNVASTCGGTVTANGGATLIGLANGSIAGGGSCTFSLSVQGNIGGTLNNSVQVTTANAGTGSLATASLAVEAPPSIVTSFGPSTIGLGASTTLTFTIANPAGNPATLTGVGLNDALPTGLTVTSASNSTCGGTLTVTAPAAIALSGAAVTLGAPCQFSVSVTGAASGGYTNITGNATSTNGGAGSTAAANLTVASSVTIAKSFSPTLVAAGGTSTLTFTIANPNTGFTASGVSFTDAFPSGMVVASAAAVTNSCGGAVTANSGASSASLGGGSFSGASCAVSVRVQGNAAGTLNNSVQVTSTNAGTGNTANASLMVEAPPSIAASFSAGKIAWNTSTNLTFIITNPAGNPATLTGVAFTGALPSGITVSGGASAVCGGTLTATAPGVIQLAGASVAAGAVCQFSVAVTGAAAGSYTSTTGNVASTNGGTGNTAAASLMVGAAITISTTPAGLQFSTDGMAAQIAPQTLTLAPGMHTIAVLSPQAGGAGTQYAFTGWSDGGAASHSITVGSSPATYVANFQTQYQLTIVASPLAGGTVTPASGSFYGAGTAAAISAIANPGYIFNGWTVPAANTANASTTVTMAMPESVTANFSSLAGVTIQTIPAGLQFSVDGQTALTAPQILTLTPGPHTLAVVTMQAGTPGTRYVFTGWSDNGAATHTITVGSSAATYTASFQTQYQLTMAVSPTAGGTVTPGSGGFYAAGTGVAMGATGNSPYVFAGWTGATAASPLNASTTVTMTGPQSATANFDSTQGIPFFNGSVAGGNLALYLQFPDATPFGYYVFTGPNWIYHADLGYESITPANDTANSVYMYDLTSGHWWFTNPAVFPYMYDFTLKLWLYCFPNTAVHGHYLTNPRYFANMTTGQIFTM